MRRSEASLAVIRRRGEGESSWLALWNANWGTLHLVGGHRDPGESHRDCLVREIAEELGLGEGADCVVGPAPLTHLEYTAWSEHARAETEYSMELFAVELSEHAERALDGNPSARWLVEDEIRSGRCRDGRPVSPSMGFLLAKSEIM